MVWGLQPVVLAVREDVRVVLGAAEMLPVWEPNQYQLHSTGLCSGDLAFFC